MLRGIGKVLISQMLAAELVDH